MCDPISMTVGMGVLSGGGAATNIIGQNTQRQMAKGFENKKRLAVEDQIAENRRRATSDFLTQVRLEQTQQVQEEEAIVEKSGDVSRQMQTTKGTALASVAERGISSDSRTVDQLISDYQFQENMETGRLRESQKLKNVQHSENIQGMETQYYNRATSIQPYMMKPQAPVDYFGPILGAVGQTMSMGAQTGAFKGA